MKKFSVWLEEKDYMTDAILGVFGGENILGDAEKTNLMGRNTNEFSNEILNRFLNLGLDKYAYIKSMAKRGVMIKDLIDKLRGENLAPNAQIAN